MKTQSYLLASDRQYIKRLLSICSEKNLSIAEIARRTHCDRATLSNKFREHRRFFADDIIEIAAALGMSSSELAVKIFCDRDA